MIQVWPDKYRQGVKNINGPHVDKNGKTFLPELSTPMPLEQALNTSHPSDAHFVSYVLKSKDGIYPDGIPLFSKHTLSQLRAEGSDLLLTTIALDWDTPGHITLTPELFADFISKFFKAGASDERLGAWSAYHTTRHGCRIIYELQEPVPVDEGEKYIVSVIKEFKRHDINFDALKDWTRRFRLPKVVRDGMHTEQDPLFTMQIRENKLDIKQFKKADLRSLIVASTFERTQKSPTQDQCEDIMMQENIATGRKVQSEFHKRAKSIIKKTPFHDKLFGNQPLAGDTGRNETFQQILGVVVPLLVGQCRATAEEIFAIFSGPVDALEVLPGKSDPRDHLWNFLQDVYEREFEKQVRRDEEKAQAVEEGQNTLTRMIEGMQQWSTAENLFDEDNSVREEYVKGRMFANIGKFYYPLGEDGWYSPLCLQAQQLIPRIKETFMKDIIETTKIDHTGSPTSVTQNDIINNHCTVVNEVRYSPLQGAKGRVVDMAGEFPYLTLPMYQRNEFLVPEYNAAVDGWLKAMVGEQNYKALAKWIGYALSFEDGPICALSITGEGGVGKKMLTEGLSECLKDPKVATGRTMTGDKNGLILETPFLVVNEGMPRAQAMSPSDTFKTLTAGDSITVRQMYKPEVNVVNPMRLIFTANDHDILHEISKGKELTPQTRKAIGDRLMHFDVDDSAVKYLARLGGRAYTEKDGARWIRGENDEPSDYVVAKHFMWLYKNRPQRNPLDRYCVMGNCNDNETFHIATQSEYLPVVMRGLLKLLQSEDTPNHKQNVFVNKETGEVFFTIFGVSGQIREVNQERVSERAMEQILKGFYADDITYQLGERNYRKADLGRVLAWAEPNTYPCTKIKTWYNIWKVWSSK